MKRFLGYGVTFLAALAIAAPALADEPPAPKKRAPRAAPARVAPVRAAPERVAPRPEPVRQTNWTGGQVGGSNGGSFANNAFADPGSYICPTGFPIGSGCYETPFSFDKSEAGYTIGPFLGYRVQVGYWVVGVEGDWAWKNISSSASQYSTTTIGAFVRSDSFHGTIKQGWDASIRGRLGALVTPWTLVYATGGVAFERVSADFSYLGALTPCGVAGCATATTGGTWSKTLTGWTVGAGVETEIWLGWKARLEYRFADFGDSTRTLNVVTNCAGSCVTPSTGATVELNPSFHTVRVGLGWDF